MTHEKILGNAGILGQDGTDSITVLPQITQTDKTGVYIED